MGLKKHFSPMMLLLLSINGMIGSAWLFGPYFSAQSAGPASLVAWILGAFAVILIAFTFAELSVLFPVAGGVSRIPFFSHGATTSFVVSWIAWLSCVTMPPIEVQAVLQYASIYFPHLTKVAGGAHVLTHLGLAWAVILMLAMSWLNMVNVSKLIKTNFIVTLFKIAIILLIVLVFFTQHFDVRNFYEAHYGGFSPGGWHGIFSAIAIGGIAFAFTGFRHGVELAAEAKNPKFAIPLAIIGSVVCCLVLYLLLQMAFIGVLNATALNKGWHGLHFTNDVGPFVGIGAILGLFWLVNLIYLNAIVSPMGAGLIYMTSTARIIYGMSQNRYFPQSFLKLNKHGVPYWCVIMNCLVGMLLFLPLPGWQNMISFLVSAVVLSYGMGPICLLSLRRQLPNAKREFKLPFANLIAMTAFYSCNLTAYWAGWHTMKKLSVAIIIGLIIFIVTQRNSDEKQSLNLASAWWLFPYLFGMMLISYLGCFGGGLGEIKFGWDFAVIAVFSVAILYLAVKSRLPSHAMESNELATLLIANKPS